MTATAARLELAAEARRLQDRGLLFREIASVLGVSVVYASDLCRDPDGSLARARKDRYRLPCPRCGTLMDGSNGRSGAPSLCASCAAEELHAQQYWTRERIVEAVLAWAAEHGRPPTAADWVRAGVTASGVRTPATANTYRGAGTRNAPFARWADVIEAAGFERPRVGYYERTPAFRAGLRRYSDADLLVELRGVAVRAGRVPIGARDFRSGFRSLLCERFGSVAAAYELVGLPPPVRGRKAERPLPDGFSRNGASA